MLLLKDQDWTAFLQQACSQIDSSEKSAGAARAKLNLLCYLCVVAAHKEVAPRLLHSPLVGTSGGRLPGTTCLLLLSYWPLCFRGASAKAWCLGFSSRAVP